MYIDEICKAYQKVFETFFNIFNEAKIKTEKDIGRKMTDDEIKLAVLFGLLILNSRLGGKEPTTNQPD